MYPLVSRNVYLRCVRKRVAPRHVDVLDALLEALLTACVQQIVTKCTLCVQLITCWKSGYPNAEVNVPFSCHKLSIFHSSATKCHAPIGHGRTCHGVGSVLWPRYGVLGDCTGGRLLPLVVVAMDVPVTGWIRPLPRHSGRGG